MNRVDERNAHPRRFLDGPTPDRVGRINRWGRLSKIGLFSTMNLLHNRCLVREMQ